MASSVTAITIRLITDIFMLILVALPSIVFSTGQVKPTQRGFFCDDESIRYPYHEGTISTTVLVLVSLFANGITIIICETLQYSAVRRQNLMMKAEPIMCSRRVNYCVYMICGYLWAFGFGIMFNQGITDIGKYTIGRLRPHFIQGCVPSNKSWVDTCVVGQFIEGIDCTQTDKDIYKDLRLSFPSGHASMSAYAMVFLACYIQMRIPRFVYSYLLKTVIQFVSISMAWYCGLSRVMDYKHHPTDVLAGFIIGTIVALFCVKYLTECFRDPYTHGAYPRAGDKKETLSISNTNIEEGVVSIRAGSTAMADTGCRTDT